MFTLPGSLRQTAAEADFDSQPIANQRGAGVAYIRFQKILDPRSCVPFPMAAKPLPGSVDPGEKFFQSLDRWVLASNTRPYFQTAPGGPVA